MEDCVKRFFLLPVARIGASLLLVRYVKITVWLNLLCCVFRPSWKKIKKIRALGRTVNVFVTILFVGFSRIDQGSPFFPRFIVKKALFDALSAAIMRLRFNSRAFSRISSGSFAFDSRLGRDWGRLFFFFLFSALSPSFYILRQRLLEETSRGKNSRSHLLSSQRIKRADVQFRAFEQRGRGNFALLLLLRLDKTCVIVWDSCLL